MATFSGDPKPRLQLSDYEQVVRARNAKGSGPVPYTPINSVPDIYTHVGHAINYGSGRRNGRTIRMLILHTTEGGDRMLDNLAYEAYRGESVSATAFVGPDNGGQIGYDVPEDDRPWTTGRWNDESLTAEIMGRASWSAATWRARTGQMAKVTDLLTDWCFRYDIPAVWLDPAQVAAGASPQSTTPRQGVNRGISDHWDCNQAARLLGASNSSTSHTDIGSGLRQVVFEDILPEVARRLNPPPLPPPIPPEEPLMDQYIVWKHVNHPEVLIVGGGGVIHADGPIRDAYLEGGAKDLRNSSDHDGVYAALMRQAEAI